MVDFKKFQKKTANEGSIPDSIPPLFDEEEQDQDEALEAPRGSKGKGKSSAIQVLKAEMAELKASVIALQISTSMKAAGPRITNDLFWQTAKQNAHLAGIRNLIDYVARRNTKAMTPEEIAQLEDHRSGFTDAIVKIFNILQGGKPDGE